MTYTNNKIIKTHLVWYGDMDNNKFTYKIYYIILTTSQHINSPITIMECIFKTDLIIVYNIYKTSIIQSLVNLGLNNSHLCTLYINECIFDLSHILFVFPALKSKHQILINSFRSLNTSSFNLYSILNTNCIKLS